MDIKEINKLVIASKTIEEFKAILKEKGLEIKEEEIQSIFNKFHANKEGQLEDGDLDKVAGGWGGGLQEPEPTKTTNQFYDSADKVKYVYNIGDPVTGYYSSNGTTIKIRGFIFNRKPYCHRNIGYKFKDIYQISLQYDSDVDNTDPFTANYFDREHLTPGN